jgi:hypothetical protein
MKYLLIYVIYIKYKNYKMLQWHWIHVRSKIAPIKFAVCPFLSPQVAAGRIVVNINMREF